MGTRPFQFVLFAEAAEDTDGPCPGLPGSAHVHRGIAHHRAAVGWKVQPPGRVADGVGVRLEPPGGLPGDDRLKEAGEAETLQEGPPRPSAPLW